MFGVGDIHDLFPNWFFDSCRDDAVFPVVGNLHIAPAFGLSNSFFDGIGHIVSIQDNLRTGIPGCAADYLNQAF